MANGNTLPLIETKKKKGKTKMDLGWQGGLKWSGREREKQYWSK